MNTNKHISWLLFILVLIVLLISAAVLSLTVGEFKIKLSALPGIWNTKDSMEYVILSKLRLPRTLLAFSVGGSLSLAGAILQGIYRNPLVEPYTLGISGGAALGITLCIVFGLQVGQTNLSLPVFGFLGAFITIFIVYASSTQTRKSLDVNRMLLTGVMISFIASSVMMLLMAITTVENLHGIIFWTMGSLNEPNDQLITIAFVTAVLGLLSSYLFVIPLNALQLGEAKAGHLGVHTAASIKILFLIASVITGVSVAVAGVIGFVGLVIPHLVRYLVGNDHRIVLPGAFLGGSIFLILSDVLARTIIAPNELPVGVITGMVGGLVFIIALKSKSYQSKAS